MLLTARMTGLAGQAARQQERERALAKVLEAAQQERIRLPLTSTTDRSRALGAGPASESPAAPDPGPTRCGSCWESRSDQLTLVTRTLRQPAQRAAPARPRRARPYPSLLAFIACPSPVKRLLKITAPPYLYSGPSPIASLASTLLGLKVNASRGDELRAMLYGKTQRVLDHLEKLGAATLNTSSFPIIEVPLADADDLDLVGATLFERGIYATLAFYPGVPRHEVGFRLQLTAANTNDQVDALLVVLDELADREVLRTGP